MGTPTATASVAGGMSACGSTPSVPVASVATAPVAARAAFVAAVAATVVVAAAATADAAFAFKLSMNVLTHSGRAKPVGEDV